MASFDSGRVTRTYSQTIHAPPQTVFSLLCPTKEGEWLEGWAQECEMIHSASGFAEDGCVFMTRTPGRPDTVWMVTRHDPAARTVEFVRVTEGLVATRLSILVERRDDTSSRVHIAYTFTPLNAAGVAFVEARHSEESFRRDMAWWEASMNHWLGTGEILTAEACAPPPTSRGAQAEAPARR